MLFGACFERDVDIDASSKTSECARSVVSSSE